MEVIKFSSQAAKIHHSFFSNSPENSTFLPTGTFIPNNHFTRCDCTLQSDNKLIQKRTHQLFDGIPVRDTFAWNNLIQTYLSNGDSDQVTSVYRWMLQLGVRADRHTLPRVLAASRLLGCLSLGKQLHCHVVKFGLSSDAYVISSLIQLYGQLDSIDSAKWYFKTIKFNKNNAVGWTLLARMYLKIGEPQLAIDLFFEMMEYGNNAIDAVAFVTVISACAMLKSLREGRRIHQIAKENGLESDVLVGNSLVKMYVDCGSLKDARGVFDSIDCKDAISWTSIINGYVKKGGFNDGLKLFRMMSKDGIRADAFAVSSILPACARVAAIKYGKEIHGHLIRNGIELNVTVQNALVDMYVKSGSIEYASRMFSRMKYKDVVSFTVMIMGYSLHGQGNVAVKLFQEMVVDNSNVKVDEMILTSVLYACFSACMIDEGRNIFNSIRSPKLAHCALMVALLARGGFFSETKAFIEERKIGQQREVVRAILDGYRIHQDVYEGKKIIEKLCDLEPLNAENYVLLSNWYAHHEKWEMVDKFKEKIQEMGLKPKKAYSWIEFKNKIHVFRTGDISHPRSECIHAKLKMLMKEMEEKEGFRITTDFRLHDVDEERECAYVEHSELLATSFGLIHAKEGTTIRVAKNLRICQSCHESVKAICKVVGREIIIKDPSCFHHFKDGCCSCRDCW